MADAWDELRELLGPLGERGARKFVDRIRQEARRQRVWNVGLRLTGGQGKGAVPKLTQAWVEPPEVLTDETVEAQNTPSRSA